MSAAGLSFRHRLLLGAVLPALLMVTVLEVVFLDHYRADIERSFLERGKAIAQQLGVAAEYGIFSGNLASLDMLAEGVRQSDADVVAVNVLDRGGRKIAGAGQLRLQNLVLDESLQVVGNGDHVSILAPIRQTVLPLEGEIWSPDATPGRPAVSGYILVEISRAQIEERSAQMLRVTVVILLLGLLLAGWISAQIAADVLSKLEAAQRELRQQKEAAEALARTDALTGIANRRAFDEAAQHEIRRALRYGTPLALLMTDIDHFKAINDTHGHSFGDQVLVDCARTLLASVREVDLVGRWGGEEFVILMPGTDIDEAVRAAERMRLAIAGMPTRFNGKTCGYTASFGVATFSQAQPTLDALLADADQALYRAKERGRNRVEAA